MNTAKTFRHGQILRLINGARISNQEELRRRLAAQKLRVTQATLSRDLQELRLIKTHEGYRQETAPAEEASPLLPLARALGEFLSDIRPAENLLVEHEHFAVYHARAKQVPHVMHELGRLRDKLGECELLLEFSFGELAPEQVLRSLERFSREVMPRFKPQPALPPTFA